MPTIQLGNVAPIEPVKVDENSTEVQRVPIPEKETITWFYLPDDIPVGDMLTSVTNVFRSHHSDAPPAWVDGDDEIVVSALSRQYGVEIGKPEGWGENETSPVDVPSVSPVAATNSGVNVNTTAAVQDSSPTTTEV